MKYLIITFFLLPFLSNVCAKDHAPFTKLTIVQDGDSLHIKPEFMEIQLRCKPFELVFHSFNTEVVYLSSSYDSTSYIQVVRNQAHLLTCFDSGKECAENPENADRDIFAMKYVDRGFHYLCARDTEDCYARFNRTKIISKNEWIGVRIVESIYVLPGAIKIPISRLSGTVLYFVYSPGIEKRGKGLKVSFK